MKLKLEPFKEFIISEYTNGKNCQQIADENNWYQQSVSNLLKKYDLYTSKRPNQGNIRYFQKCDTNIKAYLLGFITADGCLQDNGNGSKGLTLTVHEKDILILEILRDEIGCENIVKLISGPMTHKKEMLKTHCRFQLFNKNLYNDLLSYGLEERKSTTMPNIIENIPEEFRKSFILGYFDGDGSVTLNIKRNQLIVSFRGTEQFLSGIISTLGLTAHWLHKDKQKNCWTLVFWRKSDLLAFLKIYNNNNLYLSRKHERFLDFFKISKDQTISPS